ncbi:hypothetical protein LSH36_748g02068, partial [Paralvinella palmiformis]
MHVPHARHIADVVKTTHPTYSHVLVEPNIAMVTENTLLVFVQSSPGNAQKRSIIRATWGNSGYYAKYTNRTNVVVIFTLGQHYIGKSDSWDTVQQEMADNRDVLLLDIRDEYNMLSMKGLYTMKWIAARLPQLRYILKTDDDVLLNIPAWFRVIRGLDDNLVRCCIVCYVWINPATMRQHPKYSVSVQEYPHGNYPSFCSGLGYLMTRDALNGVLKASDHLPLFVRDDPYFTGMLAYIARVKLITVPGPSVIIYGSSEEVVNALQQPMFAVHDAPLPVWMVFWEQMSMDYESGNERRSL